MQFLVTIKIYNLCDWVFKYIEQFETNKRPSENATPAKPKLRFLQHGTNVFRRPQIPFCRRPAFSEHSCPATHPYNDDAVWKEPLFSDGIRTGNPYSVITSQNSLPDYHRISKHLIQTTNKRANRRRWCSCALWYAIRPDDIFSYACFGLPQTFSYWKACFSESDNIPCPA